MGDTLDTLTLTELREQIRDAVGPPSDTLEHTCDLIIDEVCRAWPERTMADIARHLDTDEAGSAVFDAIAVISAKVREQIEAKWWTDANSKAALDLVLRAIVIEFANLWFSCAEARIGMRRVIFLVRSTKP